MLFFKLNKTILFFIVLQRKIGPICSLFFKKKPTFLQKFQASLSNNENIDS
jgi:hypothetical protein